MFDVLFFLTWLLSLLLIAVISYVVGYGKAVKHRADFVEQVKNNALAFVEGLKCLKKES